MERYITVQGDTFDIVAKKIYDDETMAEVLFAANPVHIGRVVFPAGVALDIPVIQAKARALEMLPPWRTK